MPTGSYKRTEKNNRKMSKSLKGRKVFWGNKISKARMGHQVSKDTREKISKSLKGNIPWNKGRNNGKTPENKRIRNSIEFRLWREAVFARDNWICQKCGQQGNKLNPHHIQNFAQYPELRLAIDNGITLCEKCHKLFHKRFGQRNNTKEQIIKFINQNYEKRNN